MTAIESVEFESDIFASSVGIFNIVTSEHMEKMKNYALAGYVEHCYKRDRHVRLGGFWKA